MKSRNTQVFLRQAFTVMEMLMTTGVVAVTGSIMFYILNTGMILYAKNTAINVAHQQARIAVMQMEQDIHGAVSVPQLIDATRAPLASGPAAGISFQLFAGGPFIVAASTDIKTSPSTIKIQTNGVTPVVGQRLIIPTHKIEMDIVGVTAGNPCQLTVGTMNPTPTALPLPVDVLTSLTPPGGVAQSVNVVCFTTDRVSYVVQNGQLLYFGRQKDNNSKVLATDITTATPFSIPTSPIGAPYTRFVAAINLSTADPTSSNRKYKSANMFLNAMEPCRAKLCQQP